MSQKNETIAQKMVKLDELVAWFDSDEFELEQAVERFKKAETLAESIQGDLKNLKNEINVIKQRFDQEL